MTDIAFPADYTPPVSTSEGFLKLSTNGKYYFRILSSPLIGFEYWSKAPGQEKAKPIRSKIRPDEKNLIHPEVRDNKTSYPKEFYAFKVFVYDSQARTSGKIKVFSTVVKAIKESIRGYMTSPDFPSADKYDIVIEKQGEGLKTVYTVTRLDSSDKIPELIEAEAVTPVRLEAILEDKDPFDMGNDPTWKSE